MTTKTKDCLLYLVGVLCFILFFDQIRAENKSDASSHWAFQPIRPISIPDHALEDPITWFIESKLEDIDLKLSSPAERRDWVKRLYYKLTGLPPSFDDLQSYAKDNRTDIELAKHIVNHLLNSPRYGEHWARHWLDVARYSDTKGYAYASEEFNFPHAWVYRDWVINAFNNDLSYKKFVMMQLAADLMLNEGLCDRSDLAAMGFLTLGRRFISVEPDIIDDRIDVVTRGLMGLTVSCSRCHDHKFDPIPAVDYYALYGVFKSSREELVALDDEKIHAKSDLVKKKESLAHDFEIKAAELESRFLSRAAEYMLAALNIEVVPPPDFAEIIEKDDLNPAQIRRWYEFLIQSDRKTDPVFKPWIKLANLSDINFEEQAKLILEQIDNANPLLVKRLIESPLKSISDVANVYGGIFQEVSKSEEASNDHLQLKNVVFGKGSPIRVPREYVHDVEWLFDNASNNHLKKKLADLEREIIKQGEKTPHSLILVDRHVPLNVNVFKRGDYSNQGGHVGRGYLSMFQKQGAIKFKDGSGRLELSKKIVDRDNPLTARVLVNRIWKSHFGQGLVKTESDFGLRSSEPSHPDLLDFLANELIDSDWSIKHLQRIIATSSIHRLKSASTSSIDPENRFLAAFPRTRLSFEAMRDTMLSISGEINLKIGGPPEEMFGHGQSLRRSVYGKIDRQFLPSVLNVFDFANPEMHAPKRYQTNVPQQALFLMNSKFAIDRAKALSRRVFDNYEGVDVKDKIIAFYKYAYARYPNKEEINKSVQFIEKSLGDKKESESLSKDWDYGYGKFDEKSGKVLNYQRLPSFHDYAWGGGVKWPDSKLGWLRLTAEGGHVGNTTHHAAVRRWKSPMKSQVQISGFISKVEACGDGIRAWISSDRKGIIAHWNVEFGKRQSTKIDELNVEQGEILSFVVDCGEAENFSCDGFLWAPEISSDKELIVWSAQRNFSGDHADSVYLDPWQRFAQALLISNEVMFID